MLGILPVVESPFSNLLVVKIWTHAIAANLKAQGGNMFLLVASFLETKNRKILLLYPHAQAITQGNQTVMSI